MRECIHCASVIEHDRHERLDLVAGLKKIGRQSLEAQATTAIEQAIINGHFKPGSRLTEVTLSEQLGLSRGPVRAALTKLSTAGLIVQHPYASWEVIAFSDKDIWELFTLRASLECLAIELAMRRFSPAANRRLQNALKKLEDACARDDFAATSNSDFAFHKTIVELSDHGLLVEHFERVEMRIKMLISSSNLRLPSSAELLAQHVPIADAFARQDIVLSQQTLRAHILDEGRALIDDYEKKPSAA